MGATKSEQFEKWYDTTFLFSRKAASPLLVSESKTMKARFIRIKEVAMMLFENPEKDTQLIRAEIAMKYFVSMRCALDYINYAKIVVEQFKNRNP
jgi:hypothetical protein